ncbi:MAG TPA: glycoside hydrolase family 43 protein [Candidatus Acidoferrum sp.]|nr:glycoside hydrolase family 43 protein [Candidatus Acidoferrum sp.]
MITNPILPGFNPDPSIVRVGDDYYIATSTFEWYPGVQIHHSRDLVNWRLVAHPLDRAELLDMRGNPDSGGIWAPCLTWHDGLFWLIYTDVKRHEGSFKDMHNYLTTCATIDGRWSDPVYMNSSGFDASLFHDDDGKKYLVNMEWDYRPGRHPFNGILLQEYDPKQKKLVGPITNIFKGTDLRVTEAPHIYQRNGYYYLLTAEGGTGYTHAMTMARSKNLRGPYEIDPMKHMLTSKEDASLPLQRSGHGDWVETQHGEIYIVHLSGRPITAKKRCPHGRETAIQKGYWSDDGWLRIHHGGNQPELTVQPPKGLAPHPWPQPPARTEFKHGKLPLDFQWLRIPWDEQMFTLKDRPGFLRLYGHESIGSWFKQSLIARRQQAFTFTATTKLEFEPDTIQQQAGLICYYNAHKLHYLHVTCNDNGDKHLCIVSCLGEQQWNFSYPTEKAREIPLPRGMAVYLRANVDHHNLVFAWSLDGEHWNRIDHVLDYTLISDEAGRGEHKSFTGAFVGMACHDLSGRRQPADFEWFEYLEHDGPGDYVANRERLKNVQ